ncbi:MAG: hypothetical protein HYU86_03260 [Chloroflexi bacterium]|nr:hypothetical protein [Chloroflexota bacterium]
MASSELLQEMDNSNNPFLLKKRGAFAESLDAYAEEYVQSIRRGSNFISELCFEQMFDITLLIFLKESREFANKEELISAIKEELFEKLHEKRVFDWENFGNYFNSCREKLFRRRRQTPFSVTPALLLATEKRKLAAE